MLKRTQLALHLSVLGCLLTLGAMRATGATADTHEQTKTYAGTLPDRGPLQPSRQFDGIVLHLMSSPARQSQLEQFLKDQRDSSSPDYQRWISPEEFGKRFGATEEDLARVTTWIEAHGLRVDLVARGRDWIECSGAPGAVENAANMVVRSEIASLVAGVAALDDMRAPHASAPATAKGTGMTPRDFNSLYNVKALHDAGFNGSGQRIVVVGASAIRASDVEVFRKTFSLPMDAPETVVYGKDPGVSEDSAQSEMEIEWAGAVAPNATIVYAYAANPFTALRRAIDNNLGTVLSSTFGSAEQMSMTGYQTLAQQASAQGITWLNASGAEVLEPANVPEVVAVGGPSGASRKYSKPAWQKGPGVRDDGARDVPDISLSAAGHDFYQAYSGRWWTAPSGRASTPSMAGIVAILNQYLVARGMEATPGVGNMNANLYHLALNTTDVFRDPSTGAASLDAYSLVTKWTGAPASTATQLTLAMVDANTIEATVSALRGSAIPRGSVTFSIDANTMGNAMLVPSGSSAVARFTGNLGATAAHATASYPGNESFDNARSSIAIPHMATPAKVIAAAMPVRTSTTLAITSRTVNLSPCTRIEATVRTAANHVPTGSVAFYSGDTLLGKETLEDGAASVLMRNEAFSVGANPIRVVYIPAGGFEASAMAAVANISAAE